MGFKINQKVKITDAIYYDILKGLVGVIEKLPTLNENYYYVLFNSGRFGEGQCWYFMEEDLKPATNYFYAI